MKFKIFTNDSIGNEMERVKLVNEFSQRLTSLLQREGYISNRISKTGIEINHLAKAAGVSYQMARKYSLGLALPDYHIIPKIAKWLNVSPGWLLFGETEQYTTDQISPPLIAIETALLKHILLKCSVLYPSTNEAEKIVNYIVGIIYDISHINTDYQTILKIIDMMLSSAMEFSDMPKEKRA